MEKLQSLQENFKAYLLTHSSDMQPHVAGDNLRFIKKRLSVYGEAYMLRLVDILLADYPKLQKIMGKKKFQQMAHEYLAQYPSQHFSVRYLGQHLGEFLRATAPYKDDRTWQDMATFEWALTDTIDAEDGPVL